MFLKFLPTLIMVESFLACILYLRMQKWGIGVYWFAVGLLNLAVIYLIPEQK